MRFEIFTTPKFKVIGRQKWRWRLKASNGKRIATSGEAFTNKADVLKSIALVTKTGPHTEIVEKA